MLTLRGHHLQLFENRTDTVTLTIFLVTVFDELRADVEIKKIGKC